MPQTASQKVLVGSDTERLAEQPKEVEWAQACLLGGGSQVDRLHRIGFDPVGGKDSASAVSRVTSADARFTPGNQIDEPLREQEADFVEPQIASAVGGGLGEFPENG